MTCKSCGGELIYINGGEPFPLHKCNKCGKFFTFTMVDEKRNPIWANGERREL